MFIKDSQLIFHKSKSNSRSFFGQTVQLQEDLNEKEARCGTHVTASKPTAITAPIICISRIIMLFAGFVLVLSLTQTNALGQNRNAGAIAGSVSDSSGALIPGVAVDAENTATGLHIRGITGAGGTYNLPSVSSGEYTITFSKDGFQTTVQTGVRLNIAEVTVNAVLQVGSVGSKVTVTAGLELLQHETSELSTVLSSQELTALPNIGQNWANDIMLAPGIIPGKFGNSSNILGNSEAGFPGQYVTVNGSQQSTESWLVDGGVATFVGSVNPDNLVPQNDAVAEVDMETGTFSAEYGNGASTFNVITKAGTNKFHGSLYEYVQNDILNAAPKNWSSVSQLKPALRWNMFGGSIGGPIIHNRMFFFFAYQRNPVVQYTHGLYTFPTAAMRAGDFSDPSFSTIYNPATTTSTGTGYIRTPFADNKITTPLDPVALKIQDYFPMPNAIDVSNPNYNNYYFSGKNPQLQQFYDFKVSGDLKPTHHITASGLITPQDNNTPKPECPIDCVTAHNREMTEQLTETWIISNRMVNDFHASIALQNFLEGTYGVNGKGYPAKIGLPQLPSDTFPVINISTGPDINIGHGTTILRLGQTSISVADAFSWNIGNHAIKLGGEYNLMAINEAYKTIQAGTFNFTGIDTRNPDLNSANPSPGVGYADFLLGGTASWGVVVGPEWGVRAPNTQLFAQDYYKLLPNLTINYGFRFLSQGGFTEEHNRFANYRPTAINPVTNVPGALGFAGVDIPEAMQARTNFFAPRVGIAYTLRPSTTVRAGFGMFAMPFGSNAYAAPIAAVGFSDQGALGQNADNLTPVFQLSSGPPAPVMSSPATRTPSLLNGQNVTYMPYHTPISYMEQWQVDMQQQLGKYMVEAAYVGSHGVKMNFTSDLNQVPESQLGSGVRPNPTYQQISSILFTGGSNFNALEVTAKRNFSDGFSAALYYTWAKALDTGTAYGGNGSSVDTYQNAYSPAANYGASENDIRHTLNGSAVYELPFGKNRKFANTSGVVNQIIGGWQLGTILQFNTGQAFTPLMANNLSGALSGVWYPNIVGKIKVSHPSVNQWFNTSAFEAPEPNTFGNAHRNSVYGPSFVNLNLSFAKSFAIPSLGESSKLEFKADVYDLFNHPNYGAPNMNILSSGVGTISNSLTNRAIQIGGTFRF